MSAYEPNSRHLREVLFFCFNMKKSAAEAHRMLSNTYGETAISERTCRELFQRFKNDDFDVEDQHGIWWDQLGLIPAYCDIVGNEHANFLAKKGVLVIQRPTRISISNFLRLFTNMAFKYNFKREALEMPKDKNRAILDDSSWVFEVPRKAAVVHFSFLSDIPSIQNWYRRLTGLV
ncbi:solute carrier family 23 member 1 [Trichonephila clavipes]|nr:solute carrier family 23 member 1 [Trichonephila clavipes]